MSNKKVINQLAKAVSKLDTVAGMLLVEAVRTPIVKTAMRLVSETSFKLGEVINDIEAEEFENTYDEM